MNKTTLLIGAGRMGLAHLKAAQNLGLTLTAICDRSEAHRAKAAAAAGDLAADRLFADAAAMFAAHRQADLVIIATTADSHRALVELAASAGARHILCEKPMATSVADCDAMIAACEASGSKLAINHQMRFMAQYTVVRDELATGRMGPLASMTVTAGCFGLAMNGSHYCEAFSWLTGSPIVSATAWFSGEPFNNPRGPNFFDQAGEMRFASADGRRLLLNIGSDQGHGMTAMYTTRFGHMFVDEFEGTAYVTARKPEHQSLPVTRYGMPWDRSETRFPQADNVGPTEAVMRALLAGDDYPSGRDGRNVVAALAAAYKSAASGNVPVSVNDLGAYEREQFPLGLMSTKEAIRQITIKPTDPIREAARVIQAQDIKFAIVCDPGGKLLGTVTDGDIRRSLLSDIGPSEPVERIMNPHPQVTRRHDDPIKLRQMMREAVIRHLPEVDADGHVVDIFFLDGPERHEPLPNAAVLMAGGRGERLRPLTADRPKPMLSIGGKPVLERALDHLIEQGFRRFYFSINYLGHLVEDHFGDGSRFGVTISYLRETAPLGTAGALSQLENQEHPFLVMNGDLVTKAHVRAIMDLCNAGVDAVMGAREYAFTVPYGCLDVEDGRIRNIHEKPTEHRYINAGIYGLVPATLRYVRADERLDMTELFRRLIEDRRDVRFHPIAEEWMDIGNREDLAWAERLFESTDAND